MWSHENKSHLFLKSISTFRLKHLSKKEPSFFNAGEGKWMQSPGRAAKLTRPSGGSLCRRGSSSAQTQHEQSAQLKKREREKGFFILSDRKEKREAQWWRSVWEEGMFLDTLHAILCFINCFNKSVESHRHSNGGASPHKALASGTWLKNTKKKEFGIHRFAPCYFQ